MYKKILLSILFVLGFVEIVSANIVWDGSTGDGKWSNPENWNEMRVPGYSDIVEFNSSSNINCLIDMPIVVEGIFINGYTGKVYSTPIMDSYVGNSGIIAYSGTMEYSTGRLTVYGPINFNGGNFSIEGVLDNGSILNFPLSNLFCYVAGISLNEQNYFREESFMTEIKDETLIPQINPDNIKDKFVFMNGLGTSIEIVNRRESNTKRDIVQLIENDIYQRPVKKYVPYEKTDCSGVFVPVEQAKFEQISFYATNSDKTLPKVQIPSSGVPNTFEEIVYENSSMAREIERANPGEEWSRNNGNTLRTKYRYNNANEVLFWNYDPVSGNASCKNTSANAPLYYDKNSLKTTEIKDANGSIQIQVEDYEGKILLKRQQLDATTYADLYFIYDKLGMLRYVVPPQATTLLASSQWTLYGSAASNSFTYLNCYVYKYDSKKRLIEKYIPGTGPLRFVYDKLDRVVLKQNALEATDQKWEFNKYDAKDRIVMTGFYTSSNTREVEQNNVISSLFNSESRINNAQNHYYSSVVYPNQAIQLDTRKVYYYDHYDINLDQISDFSYVDMAIGVGSDKVFEKPLDLITCQKVKNTVNSGWLVEVNFFDDKLRTIQTQKNNHLYLNQYPGSAVLSDKVSSKYDFAGNLLQEKKVHNAGVGSDIVLENRFTYDHRGRRLHKFEKLNSQPEILISSRKYNAVGKQIEENIHSEDNGVTYLQSVDYRYNISGWLTSINNSDLSNDFSTIGTNDDVNDVFGMNINYESLLDVQSKPQYNSNISSVSWKNLNPGGTSLKKAYNYFYNKNNWLVNSEYKEMLSGAWSTFSKRTEKDLQYDLNGNILQLKRYSNTGSGLIDNLSYSYNGNQLTKILDTEGTAGFNYTAYSVGQQIQYSYDLNGNMVVDLNKAVAHTYNYYNLPIQTSAIANNPFGSFTVVNKYSEDGVLLRRSEITTSTNNTDFVGNYVYENGIISSIQIDEGRIAFDGSVFKYEYTLKDNLGSIRATFDKGTDGLARVIQINSYYPYGLQHGEAPEYSFGSNDKKLFNGKGKENFSNYYNYGARLYQSEIGRWFVRDQLAEKYYEYSPYSFVGLNPVGNVEKDGKDWYRTINWQFVWIGGGDPYMFGGADLSAWGLYWFSDGPSPSTIQQFQNYYQTAAPLFKPYLDYIAAGNSAAAQSQSSIWPGKPNIIIYGDPRTGNNGDNWENAPIYEFGSSDRGTGPTTVVEIGSFDGDLANWIPDEWGFCGEKLPTVISSDTTLDWTGTYINVVDSMSNGDLWSYRFPIQAVPSYTVPTYTMPTY